MTALLWRVMLAGVAVVAICAQLDRASTTHPQLAPFVPPPFRSLAQPSMTMLALAQGGAREARAEAVQLVRRRPLPAEHLFVLALSDLRNGDLDGYARAFERSTERGWRATAVQQAAAQASLARGDVKAASNRIAALWAVDASDPAIPRLTRSLLTSGRGRRAFAARLAGTRIWQNLYLSRALEFTSPAEARVVVDSAVRAGARFDPTALRAFGAALIRQRTSTGDSAQD